MTEGNSSPVTVSQPRSPIEGAAAWFGQDLADRTDWIHTLSAREVDEVAAAVAAVRQRSLAILEVTRRRFPLPSLGPTLVELQRKVVNGRGFMVLRGLPVDGYSIEQAAIAFWGIGTYLGEAVSQNAKGHVLGHVKDIGHDPSNPEHRIYATSARQRFHTDSCDIVGLLCLQPAKRGGLSSIVSSVTIQNEMLRQRPDLVEVLARPFYVDRKGEIPSGKGPHYQMPVFNDHAGYLTTIYSRDFIEAAQRFPDVPRLTPTQLEALDLLDALANDPDLRLDMMLEPGDMQFLHNHQVLHARTAYEDHAEPERRRHLLRLWLSPANARPLPPVFAERYGNIEEGTRRGGILLPGTALSAPLEAE